MTKKLRAVPDEDAPDTIPRDPKAAADKLAGELELPKGLGIGATPMIKKTLKIKLAKPHPRRFIRVHPELKKRVAVFVDPNDEDEFERAEYLLTGAVAEELETDCFFGVLRVYYNKSGSLGLWLLKEPKRDQARADVWALTRMQCAEVAETKWIRIHRSDDGQGYGYTQPESEMPEPEWERILGNRDMNDLVSLAARDRIIDSLDHPVIQGFFGR